MVSDLELLSAWRAGDASAGNELFDRYFDALYRFYADKISRGVEDLVQKAFLACVEGRDRIEEGASFRAYLYACARKLLYKEYRDRKPVDFGVTSLHALQPSPSRMVAEKGEQRLLLEALRRVPLDYQIALELYYWEGMKGPELAAALDIPEGTVRTRLRRGVIQLRKHMEELATSGDLLESTLANLDDWAASLRGLAEEKPD